MSQKKSLSAKEVITDIRAGAGNEFLMKKYGLTPKGLQSVFQKLVDAGLITKETINARNYEETAVRTDGTIVIAQLTHPPVSVKVCPACKFPQEKEFETCPQCGVIVGKFLKKQNGETPDETSQEEPVKTSIPPHDTPTDSGTDSQERVKRVSRQEEIRDKITESSLVGRITEFIKTPRNAAIAGVAGLLVVLIVGYLVYAKVEKQRANRLAATIAFKEIFAQSSKIEPNLEILKELLEQGADVNTLFDFPPDSGLRGRISALHLASANGDLDHVKLLLKRGANPNIIGRIEDEKRSDTATPLMFAASGGFAAITAMLLKAGADPNLKTEKYKRTALDGARANQRTEVVKLLIAYGAKK